MKLSQKSEAHRGSLKRHLCFHFAKFQNSSENVCRADRPEFKACSRCYLEKQESE